MRLTRETWKAIIGIMNTEAKALQGNDQLRQVKLKTLSEAMGSLDRDLSEVEASCDSVGASATVFKTEELELMILRLDEAKGRLDAARKVINRNRTLISNALSKQLLGAGVDFDDRLGHRFKIDGRSFWGAPSKKKEPEAYKRFCDMLIEKYGAEGVDIKTEIVIDGEELSALCDRLREEGQPDLPDVREHNELTIKTRKLPNGTADQK